MFKSVIIGWRAERARPSRRGSGLPRSAGNQYCLDAPAGKRQCASRRAAILNLKFTSCSIALAAAILAVAAIRPGGRAGSRPRDGRPGYRACR